MAHSPRILRLHARGGRPKLGEMASSWTLRGAAAAQLAAALLLSACGGGGSPAAPASPTPSPSSVALRLVDGDGAPVEGASLLVDGLARAPRAPNGSVFEIERGLAGHALDVQRDGFLVYQTLVPDREAALDLFAVPRDASKAWIRSMLYDGVINRSGNLARLTRPVSLVPGSTLSPSDWARVREVVEAAGLRMGGVTGYAFQVTDQPLPGTVAYTFDVEPGLAFGGYFEWSGRADTIERAAVHFRSLDRMGDFSLVLHELTHGFGLSHSDRLQDVMHPAAVSETHAEREIALIAAVKRRPPGTSFEDNLRTATGSRAQAASSRSFLCGTR